MPYKAIDSDERFSTACADIGLGEAVVKCLEARGYKTVADFAFSVDPTLLDALILGGL